MASGRPRIQKPIGAGKKQAALSFLSGIKLDGAPSLSPAARAGPLQSPSHDVARSTPIEIFKAPTPLGVTELQQQASHKQSFPKRSISLSESPLAKPNASPEKHGVKTSTVTGLGLTRQGESFQTTYCMPVQLPTGVQQLSENNATAANLQDVRVILHTRGSFPFCMFSIKSYDADRNRSIESSAERYTTRIINRLTGDLATLDVPVFENLQGVVVSYHNLLDALVVKPPAVEDVVVTNPLLYRRAQSTNVDDDGHYDALTFAQLKEDETNVIVDYQPHSLDDPNLRYGKHCTFMPLQSYAVSLLEYARPSTIKKALNERFHEKFPRVQLTLSKLRSLKNDMLDVSRDERLCLDLGAVALAYVYFEKMILLGKINKSNRKYLAAVCLLLAAKFSDATREVKDVIDVLVEKFRLSRKALLAAEVPVLVSLQFTLLVPESQVVPHYNSLMSQAFA